MHSMSLGRESLTCTAAAPNHLLVVPILEENLSGLHGRLRDNRYVALPVEREC